MAVQQTISKRTLNLYVKDGVNTDGSDSLKTKTYSKIKAGASAEDILAVAEAIGGLMVNEVAEVALTEKSLLAEQAED